MAKMIQLLYWNLFRQSKSFCQHAVAMNRWDKSTAHSTHKVATEAESTLDFYQKADGDGIIFEPGVPTPHVPVLKWQVTKILKPQNSQVFVDMTFGAGGHTKALLQEAPQAQVFALDRDPVAFDLAQQLSQEEPNITPLLGRFSEVHKLLAKYGFSKNSVDGILFDAGASSMQYDEAQRGFSIRKDGPLDMRMETNSTDQATAADIVNYMDEEGLRKVLKHYGEEKKARLIARAIIDSRNAFGKITTTKQLANVVASVFQGTHKQDMLMRHSHVATKTFQALRIFVNNELNELYNGLSVAHHLLKPHGVCIAIAFHSLEDRIIKRHFHGIDMDEAANMSINTRHRNSAKTYSMEEVTTLLQKKWTPLQKQAMIATAEEVESNPRARSAKLRAAFKMPRCSDDV